MTKDTNAIKKAVTQKLQANLQLRRMGVEVEADSSGSVTLRGNAHGFWSRQLAQDLTTAVDGVTAVNNELSIVTPAPRLKRFRAAARKK